MADGLGRYSLAASQVWHPVSALPSRFARGLLRLVGKRDCRTLVELIGMFVAKNIVFIILKSDKNSSTLTGQRKIPRTGDKKPLKITYKRT